jgi:hypothetical protein
LPDAAVPIDRDDPDDDGVEYRLQPGTPAFRVILQHFPARYLPGEALRQLDLPPGKGRDQRYRHDQDDKHRDQRRQKHRRR